MSDPEVIPDTALGGGHALIRVPGAGVAATDPRFRLTRDGYDAGTLGPWGWQVADTLLEPLSAQAEGADLVLSVGPALVDVVESGVVVLGVPAAKFDQPVFWPELPLSRGGAGRVGLAMPSASPAMVTPSPLQGLQKVEPTPPPPDDPIIQLPPSTSIPASRGPPVVVPTRRSVLPFVVIGLLVLAAASGGFWYVLHRPTQVVTSQPPAPTPPQPPPHPTPPTPPPTPAAPPTTPPPANTTARDCGQGSIVDMVACTPDPSALATLAQRKWDGGQADQGLVLMQIAADRGSGAAALKLAQIYDPNTPPQADGRVQPNAREAAQYYRRAVQAHEDAATAPREALHRRLQHDADEGDAMAPLTLKDFWP